MTRLEDLLGPGANHIIAASSNTLDERQGVSWLRRGFSHGFQQFLGCFSALSIAIAKSDTLDKREGVHWLGPEEASGLFSALRVASIVGHS
jgi:hypothetical protein